MMVLQKICFSEFAKKTLKKPTIALIFAPTDEVLLNFKNAIENHSLPFQLDSSTKKLSV